MIRGYCKIYVQYDIVYLQTAIQYLYLCRILLRESVTRQADHIPGQRCPGQHCMSQNFSEHPYFYKIVLYGPETRYTPLHLPKPRQARFLYYLLIV